MYKNEDLEDLRFCINEIRTCTSLPVWDVISPDQEIGAVVKETYSRVLRSISSLNDVAYINANLDAIRAEWTVGNLFKKFRYAPPSFAKDRKIEAITGFIDRNSACRGYRVSPNVRYVMRQLLAKWLPKPTLRAWPISIGPGAVCDVPRATYFDKFSQLVNNLLLPIPFTGSGERLVDPWACGGLDTAPCRLCAVPKDYYRDRLITVEPCLLAFGQQDARRVIYASIAEGPLRKRPINHLRFADPTFFFRRMALKGSVDGSWGTIDLSNASDLISWDDIRDIFPSWLVAMLECVRSAQFSSDGETRDMYMYAGMGNATTFVVESLFFRAIVHAFAIIENISRMQAETFGDDIIIGGLTDSGYLSLMSFLADNGLIVNQDKSYTSSTCLFRESCGEVALAGHSIRTYRFYGYSPAEYPSLCDLLTRMACDSQSIRVLAQRILESGVGRKLLEAGTVMVPDTSINLNGAMAIPEELFVNSFGCPAAARRWSTSLQTWEFRLPIIAIEGRPRLYSRSETNRTSFNAAKFWTHLYGVALPSRGDDRVAVPGSSQRPRFRWRWRR